MSSLQQCSQCGAPLQPEDSHCPDCQYPVAPTTTIVNRTRRLPRQPQVYPFQGHSDHTFAPTASVIFQFLPSGTCLTNPMRDALILGRCLREEPENMLDLTEFNAHQHGVSRHHCRLERRDNTLVVIDLGSTNGSHLNGEPLLPHRDYPLSHGDRLTLGTLHLLIFFSPG